MLLGNINIQLRELRYRREVRRWCRRSRRVKIQQEAVSALENREEVYVLKIKLMFKEIYNVMNDPRPAHSSLRRVSRELGCLVFFFLPSFPQQAAVQTTFLFSFSFESVSTDSSSGAFFSTLLSGSPI